MGRLWFGNAPEDDVTWARLIEQGQQRAEAAAALWDQSHAAYAARIGQMAPWLHPGTALALAKGDASPAAIQQAARISASRLAQMPNVLPGSTISGYELAPGHSSRFVTPNQVENWGTGRPLGFTGRLLSRARDRAAARVERQVADKFIDAEMERLRGIGLLTEDDLIRVPVTRQILRSTGGDLDMDRVRAEAPDAVPLVEEALGILERMSPDGKPVPFITSDNQVLMFSPRDSFLNIPDTRPTGGRALFGPLGTLAATSRGGIQGFTESIGRAIQESQVPQRIIAGVGEIPNPLAQGQALQGMETAARPTGGTGVPQPEREVAGLDVSNIKKAIQSTGIVLNAPIQEFTGQIRNAYAAFPGTEGEPNWGQSQSDLGIMMNTDMEPGDGFFVDPDSEVHQERLRREAERGLLHGHRITLGRLAVEPFVGWGMVEPDTTPYRVMTGLVDVLPQVFDPVAVGTAGVGKGLAARRLFVQGSEEIVQAASRSAVGTSTLRSIASGLEVRGRSGMDREALLGALSIRRPAEMPVDRLKAIATALNIPGRTSMTTETLRSAVGERWGNLGGTVTPAATLAADEAATPLLGAVGAGVANVPWRMARITGIPQALSRAGIIKGDVTNYVHGPTSTAWFASDDGIKKVNQIAETSDVLAIDQATKGHLFRHEIRALRDATTPEQVRDALRPMLEGGRMRTVDDVWNPHLINVPGSSMLDTLAHRRWLTDVPGSYIDLDDPRSAIDETVSWLRNIRVDEETISGFINQLVDAKGNQQIIETVANMMRHTDGVLARAGVKSAQVRSELTDYWVGEMQDAQNFFVAQATGQQSFDDAIDVGGKMVQTGGPYEWHGAYNRFIYLPDYRQLRRLTNQVPGWKAIAADDTGELHGLWRGLQTFQEEAWKPLTLLRGAWPVRVIGEEQIRMAASGYAGMFNHPLSHIAYVIARKEDVSGNAFDIGREYIESQVRGRSGWLVERVGSVRTGQQTAYAKGDRGYTESWGETLLDMSQDPVIQHLAEHGDIARTQDWLLNGEGKPIYEKMVRDHREMFERGQTSVREYLESGVHWIDRMTGGNDELLRVIREGTLQRHRIIGSNQAFDPNKMKATPALLRKLRSLDEAGPEEVLGVKNIADLPHYQGAIVDRMFSFLMGTPTNTLSRSPVFRQAYLRRMEEIVSFMTPEAKAEFVRYAEGQGRLGWFIKNVPREQTQRIKAIAAKGRLDLEDADAFAKGYALDETKTLLYDLNKKSQIMDATRMVVPFGEAWREVITRWASLMNPASLQGWKNIRRFQQIMAGARGEELGNVLGAPPGEGFFWKDQYGELVFMYPGSQWAVGMATEARGTKIPVPLIGRVQGLSMISEVLPGVGPVAQIPVSYLLPDKPGIRGELREWILPFGSPTDEQGITALGQFLSFAPPWMRRGIQALTGSGYDQETNRLYANTVMYVANYLYSTGKYDTSTEEGKAQLLKDAKAQSGTLYGVRALASWFAPSAPSPDWVTRTNDGLVRTAFLTEEYHRLIEKHGFEDADEMFLERFGLGVGMAMQAHTFQTQGGVEPTEAFDHFAGSSEGHALRDSYPATWGYYGPEGGKFDYESYIRSIRRGDVQTLTEEEWFNLGQNHLGQVILDGVYDELGPEEDWTEEDRAYKRQVTGDIRAEYPGFRYYEDGPYGRASKERVLTELAAAVQDKKVLSTQAGEALSIYWEARMKVIGWAQDEGLAVPESEPWIYDLSKANRLSEDRTWLYDYGERLAEAFPDFERLWDFQLRYEVLPEDE